MKKLQGNIIYQIKNVKTGQCYVGRTCDFTRRKWQHFKALKNGKHSSPFLQRAYNKYGDEAFQMEALCHGLSKEKAKSIEQKLLDRYYDELYNCSRSAFTPVGPGDTLSEEHKHKISEANKGAKNHLYAPFTVTFPDGTIDRWETIREAAAAYDVSNPAVWNYLNGARTPGNHKSSAHLKGTVWAYTNNKD